MQDHLRAIVAVLLLSIPVLWALRRPLTASAIEPTDYKVRAGLWIGLTGILFVAHSFWLFMLVAALALLTIGRKDSNPLGLYFFLLFLAPPFQSAIPGFAGIKNFLALDYLRLLSFLILLPLSVRLWRNPDSPRLFKMPADKYLLGYVALQLVLQAPETTSTNLLRSLLSLVLDIVLPYYAFSRGLSDLRRQRDAFASFVAAGSVMAVIAVFEVFKGWLLYSSLPDVLDVNWGFGTYMMREGTLRPAASAGHSIVLGYVLMVALGLQLTLRSAYPLGRSWQGVLLLLGAGIVASVSRGPWVGAAAMLTVAVVMGRSAGRIAKVALLGAVVVPVLMLTPVGAKLVALLPFVGNVDETVEYRQLLFRVGWDVLMQNPIFGSIHYRANALLEPLRQGQQIIDVVNSYLNVAMMTGFVGLSLFVGVFASSVRGLWLHLRHHGDNAGDDYVTGRALLATLVGVLVTIATVSSVNAVPTVYWCLAGACAAYLGSTRGERHAPLRSGTAHSAALTTERI